MNRGVTQVQPASICSCVCAQVCVCAFGCCFVGTNGCIPLTMLVDVCQCCCLLMFVRLPLSRHFPCCKTWWIKNLNLNLNKEDVPIDLPDTAQKANKAIDNCFTSVSGCLSPFDIRHVQSSHVFKTALKISSRYFWTHHWRHASTSNYIITLKTAVKTFLWFGCVA